MLHLKKIVFMMLFTGLSLQASQIITINQQQQSDLGISVQKASKLEYILLNPYNGTVVLAKKDIITISPHIESIVSNIYVSDFEHVKKGQKLLSLKSNALLDIQKEYVESLIEYKNILQNYQRDIKLQEKGLISAKRVQEVTALKDSLDVKIKLLESQLLTNGFTSSMIQNLQSNLQPILTQDIYASRSGTVYNIDAKIGEFVQAEHMIMGIYSDGDRYIDISVPVKDIDNISIGDRCTFAHYSATVSAIGNVVNRSSQSVQVRAKVDNTDGLMINRVYGVTIQRKVDNAVKIKKSALVFEENNSYVFKKNTQGFEVVSVEVISEGPVCYVVKGKLQEGDLLAVSSTAALLSAMDVEDE